MTCIAGLVADGKVYMGADSAGVSGLDLRVRADKKLFRKGHFIIGCTTSFRMQQIIQYDWSEPGRLPDEDVMHFMVTGFVKSLRIALKEGGFAKKNAESEEGGNFLVGYQGRLFSIEGDYQVAEHTEPYAAVGCGFAYAIGSLYSTGFLEMLPHERIATALRAAETFSAGVRGPFHTEIL